MSSFKTSGKPITTTNPVAPIERLAFVQHRGASMAPTIKSGEWVQVDPSVTTFTGPGLYLTAWSTFKATPAHPSQVPAVMRLDYVDGALHSVPDDPLFPLFKVELSDLLIGGKVVSH